MTSLFTTGGRLLLVELGLVVAEKPYLALLGIFEFKIGVVTFGCYEIVENDLTTGALLSGVGTCFMGVGRFKKDFLITFF